MTQSDIEVFFTSSDELTKQLYNNKNYVEVDFHVLSYYNEDYALKLVERPRYILAELHSYAKGKQVRIKNLITPTNIHEISTNLLYKLIQVRGVVTQISAVMPRASSITYVCESCGEPVTVDQNYQWKKEPDKCLACKKGGKFRLDLSTSTFDDTQWITIQELVENTPAGKTPDAFKVFLKNDLVGQTTPGEEVTIIGVPIVQEKASNTSKLDMVWHIEANNVIYQGENQPILKLTPQDVEQVRQLMSQPDHLDNVIKSYAPTIYGLEHVKEALAYQQCEGVPKISDKNMKRGQFHILLAGPMGTGKSELGKYSARYHVKGREATGRGASGVGITASVVQEDGEWVLKAGAMVLADNGLLFIDEIEKMSKTDSGAIHPAMEQQEIPISKAGINAMLKTRCSVLAACNPLTGEWNEYKNLVGNLHDGKRGIPLPLLDRFALKFVVKLPSDIAEERKVAEHIARVNTHPEQIQPPYDVDTLRKIFSYARTLQPIIPDKLAEEMTDFYLRLFKASTLQNIQIISRRQIEDLFRLTEASAKLNGRETATDVDMKRAVAIVSKSLNECYFDMDTGMVDQTKALYGEPKSKRDCIKETPALIQRLCKRNTDITKVSRDKFIEYASKTWRCAKHEAGEALEVCLKDGSVFCPTPYTVATTVTTLDED